MLSLCLRRKSIPRNHKLRYSHIITPDSFIKTWQANTRNEASGSKPRFLDLCTLLDVPPPHSDPNGTTYAFEKGVKKAAGGGG